MMVVEFLSLLEILRIQVMSSVSCDHRCHEIAREIYVGIRREMVLGDKL
jgi:hypothetical protein